jgi:hypothetical protein
LGADCAAGKCVHLPSGAILFSVLASRRDQATGFFSIAANDFMRQASVGFLAVAELLSNEDAKLFSFPVLFEVSAFSIAARIDAISAAGKALERSS